MVYVLVLERPLLNVPYLIFESVDKIMSHHDRSIEIRESLRNDDGDGNKNGKKAIGSDWQNNNFARASRFFVDFFAVTARKT